MAAFKSSMAVDMHIMGPVIIAAKYPHVHDWRRWTHNHCAATAIDVSHAASYYEEKSHA
jgi:hypothetical protein